ncbi:rap guanine nucleotide exchange factor 4 [Myzus persicae]|uniref:rap guanine nucleotide exchange factor 4 n=1 Tax=Myzus persicae TaxID=13164 RepID=UPI000B931DE8|nr:rap guanine nucleotide exchange factor 4 [Myzus persicae]
MAATEWITAIDKRPSDRSAKDVEAITSRLRRVDTLNRLPNSVLQQLAFVGYYEDLERGVMLYRQGEIGSSWYAVLGGSLEARLTHTTQTSSTNTDKAVVSLDVGATFGESIVHDLPRDMTVCTKTTCELLRIHQNDFKKIWDKHSNLMKDLIASNKLRNGMAGGSLSKCQSPPPVMTQARRTITPDNPDPAEVITENPSMPMARAGWVLRTLLLSDQNTVLRDRKTGGGRSVVRRCASGSELIDWLMNLVSTDHDSFSRHDVIGMWQALLEEGVISHATGEHPFKDKCLFYNFWQDREGALNTPTIQDVAEAEEHLDEALQELVHRGPDAHLRLILRSPSSERTPEDLELIFEELNEQKALAHLPSSVKRELASVVVFEAHPKSGHTLFRQGDDGKAWYVIMQGAVSVETYSKGVVESLYDGEDFGGLALIHNVPRSATITVKEDNTHLLRVDKDSYNKIVRDIEANTVRLKELGSDVLVLEKSPRLHKYMIIAGTPQKILEHLLEHRLSSTNVAGSRNDPCLDDFLLTHIVFMPTRTLVSELNKYYHMENPAQDREYTINCKRKVVQFVYRWVVTIRHPVFDDVVSMSFLEELASDVEADCQLLGGKSQALQEEASLMHHIMSRLRRYQDERLETTGLKWKLPPGGQPICLFSAISNPSKNNRPILRPNDDIIFRVYCADHTFCTLRLPVNATAETIKVGAYEKCSLRHPVQDLRIVEVKSNGERVPFRDSEHSIPTSVALNSCIFLTPKDHMDALTCVPEQEKSEGAEISSDFDSLSTKELAYHMTLFDWELFWNVHEYELIYLTFGRHRFQQITANLDIFLRRFNEIQYWVITEICTSQNISKRTNILKKMIKLATYCKEYYNFNAFFAILMGLSDVAVSRLSTTWDKLPSKSRKQFTEYETLIDPSRNHRAYRITVGKLPSPMIPFMPLLIKDMKFTHDGNKTHVDGLVNFEKMHMLAQTMRTLRYCRARHLVLEPPVSKNEADVKSYVSCLRCVNNERTLMSMSQKLEPRRT